MSKWYLAQYQAVFQWGFNIKAVTDEFLRILSGIPPGTDSAPLASGYSEFKQQNRERPPMACLV